MNETTHRASFRVLGAAVAGALLAVTGPVRAQVPPRQTIEITSSFKPVLREPAKLPFAPAPPRPDTTPPRLTYLIPASNVIPPLTPFGIRPLTRPVDSASSWSNANHLRLGYGNLGTPVVEAGLSFGDTRHRAALSAGHQSSRGPRPFQDVSRTRLRAEAALPAGGNAEWSVKAGLARETFFQYGFDTALFRNVGRDDVLRRYTTVSVATGLRNLAETEFGLRYHPTLSVDLLTDNRSAGEADIVVDLPVERSVGERFTLGLGVNADLTRLSPDGLPAIANDLFTVPLTLAYQGEKAGVKAGIIPSWDNGAFVLLPTLRAEVPIAGEQWVLQAGWIGHYEKGSYKRLSALNPYIDLPADLRNTRLTERYAGFRGVLAKTFTYNARAGVTTFRNAPLFVNHGIAGRAFRTLFEERLEALHIRGEIGYVQGEQFSLQAGLNIYGFTKQVTEEKPWGMIPLELEGHLRWRILKDLSFTTDMYLWRGAAFRQPSGATLRLAGAFDLNAGLEFRVARKLSIWARFQNITNARYQRWNQYDAYGFNLTGGLALQF